MTSHYPSATLRFRNTDNRPFCYAIDPQSHQRPSKVHTRSDGNHAVVEAVYRNGRGECASPVTAEFTIPISRDSDGRLSIDVEAATTKVTRHEDDIFDFGEPIDTPTTLHPRMVTGLIASLDDHVNVAPKDPGSVQAVVDAAELKELLFDLAVKASDLGRNGGHLSAIERVYSPVDLVRSEVPVSINTRQQALVMASR